jgi:hypothetical protein
VAEPRRACPVKERWFGDAEAFYWLQRACVPSAILIGTSGRRVTWVAVARLATGMMRAVRELPAAVVHA